MAKPYKLRYVNELAGAFVLVCVLLVIGGVVLVARAQRWFSRNDHISLVLPLEGSLGLQRGGAVLILGTSAGTVENITVSADGRMLADISIRSDFTRFVRSDSVAVIRRTFGVGDAYIEISRGNGDPLPAVNPSIPAVADEGPTQAVNELITAVRTEVVPTLQELRRSLEEYTRLAQALGDPKGPLQQSLGHLRNVTADVDSGHGLAGRLVRDPALADQAEALLRKLNTSAAEAEQLVADLRKTSARLPKMADSTDDAIQQLAALTGQTRQTLQQAEAVLKDLRGTTSQLPDTLKSVNRSADDLPGLMLQADETLRQTQRLVEAIQRNWWIRSEVRDETPGRIPPGQAGVQP